jgi:hypothetical protein
MASRARPARREPVKPAALMRASATRPCEISMPASCSRAKTPDGRPQAFTASWTARPTSSDVPGWAGWALTTTGQPAARAEAVSPPATEKASGKFDAPNTATGPSGTLRRRRSGRGSGLRSGWAGSIRASSQPPSRSTPANIFSWPMVRPRSPSRRARGRPVSAMARTIRSSPIASILAAMVSRNTARCSGEVARYGPKAAAARAVASSRSALVAPPKVTSRVAPVLGSTAWIAPPVPGRAPPSIRSSPVMVMARSSCRVRLVWS